MTTAANESYQKAVGTYALEEEAKLEAREIAAKRHAEKKAGGWAGWEADPFDEPPSPLPAHLHINGNGPVVPAGTVTVLSGARSSGKTWVAAAWATQEITAGRPVVWIDFERQKGLLRDKLACLGVPPHLSRASLCFSSQVPPVEAIRALGDSLVVIDAWRGLQGRVAPGTSANDGDSVETVYREYIDELTRTGAELAGTGATVCVIDHLTKDGKSGTFGSERKESAADLVITVEMGKEFAKDEPGYAVLAWSKDRYGNHAAGKVAGYLWHPGDGSKTGSGLDSYPDRPELRNWSPVKATLAMVATPLTRDLAVSQIVGQNRLKLGSRAVAVAVAAAHPGLFGKAANPGDAAHSHVRRMIRECKLTQDSAGNIDVPSTPAEDQLMTQLQEPEYR